MRNNKVFLKFIIFTLILTFSIVFTVPQGVFAAKEVKLMAGNLVLVKTTNTLNPSNLHMGDEVTLTVVQDVVVDGNTVIKAGSLALGTVTYSERNGMLGKAGKLGISVNSVKAVDGTDIALSGKMYNEGEDKAALSLGVGLLICLPFLLMKGEKAAIPANTSIHAKVLGTYTISVNQ